jgi:hypothetical protein
VDFAAALMPSSEALIVISPPLISTSVPSMPSEALMVKVPPSISQIVVAWMPSSSA